jgi:uncharacterized protein YegP (UPF0339 family)
MKFVIRKALNGEYMFLIVARNGKIVCQSETYSGLSKCKGGIAAVKKCAKAKVVIE